MRKHLFFCENCGNSVSLNAKSCPYCGKSFDAVKCPQCSFSGSPDLFRSGCPNCGYLSDQPSQQYKDVTEQFVIGKSDDGTGKIEKGSALPTWVYWFIGAGLVGLIMLFILLYINL